LGIAIAMLALTNHVIMQVTFVQTQSEYLKGSGQYAILGDDVAMSSLSLSTEYELLMRLCRNKSNKSLVVDS